MANTWYQEQLQNKNYLSPIGFVFLLDKAPKTSFLCQKAVIPDMALGTANVPTRGMVSIPMDGNVVYGELTLQFIVDEDLKNYLELHNWIRALGQPAYMGERMEWREQYNSKTWDGQDPKFSDGTLQVLNNNNRLNFNVVFEDMFPTQLSTLDFDVTGGDQEYFTASATFNYTFYEIRNKLNKRIKTSE